MQIETISDFRKAVRHGPYSWPGGYPTFWIMADTAAVSFAVAKTERRNMLEALRNGNNEQWRPVALEVNWENSELVCDHTGERLPSAYGDDNDD